MTTIGDLTPRHIGRTITIAKGTSDRLPLNTPVEVAP